MPHCYAVLWRLLQADDLIVVLYFLQWEKKYFFLASFIHAVPLLQEYVSAFPRLLCTLVFVALYVEFCSYMAKFIKCKQQI